MIKRVWLGVRPPAHLCSCTPHRSTFLLDKVSTTSLSRFLSEPTFHVATLNLVGCSLDSLQWPDPASRTREEAKPETLPARIKLPAPPITDSFVRLATVISRSLLQKCPLWLTHNQCFTSCYDLHVCGFVRCCDGALPQFAYTALWGSDVTLG